MAVMPPPLRLDDPTALRAQLVRTHLAVEACPLPAPVSSPGITWVIARNGVWKRGVSAALDLLIPVQRVQLDAPGLASVIPHARFRTGPPGRLKAGRFLQLLLEDARKATAPTGGNGLARPIEKQYFIGERGGRRCLLAPLLQQGTPGQVRYVPPKADALLVDIHSHHQLPAFFSGTDDRDDTGLSISAVVGTIFTRPTITVRLNVYGHRYPVPALLIFDELGPFIDGGLDADPES